MMPVHSWHYLSMGAWVVGRWWPTILGPVPFLIELNEIYQGDQHRHWLCAKEV